MKNKIYKSVFFWVVLAFAIIGLAITAGAPEGISLANVQALQSKYRQEAARATLIKRSVQVATVGALVGACIYLWSQPNDTVTLGRSDIDSLTERISVLEKIVNLSAYANTLKSIPWGQWLKNKVFSFKNMLIGTAIYAVNIGAYDYSKYMIGSFFGQRTCVSFIASNTRLHDAFNDLFRYAISYEKLTDASEKEAVQKLIQVGLYLAIQDCEKVLGYMNFSLEKLSDNRFEHVQYNNIRKRIEQHVAKLCDAAKTLDVRNDGDQLFSTTVLAVHNDITAELKSCESLEKIAHA
ncbi:MAG: hypothetical protein WC707_01825 [Candidatus Babeliaceae bacterium]|jgi:hypothetical protein